MPLERYEALCEAWNAERKHQLKCAGYEIREAEPVGSAEDLQRLIVKAAKRQKDGKLN